MGIRSGMFAGQSILSILFFEVSVTSRERLYGALSSMGVDPLWPNGRSGDIAKK